jgi:hypothetical protein
VLVLFAGGVGAGEGTRPAPEEVFVKNRVLRSIIALALASAVVLAVDIQINTPDHASSSRDNNTTQSETNHAATPNAIVAAWNDSHQIATTGTMWTSLMSWGYSSSGASFTDAGFFQAPKDWAALGDPAVVADTAGKFYVASLLTNDGAFTIGGLAVSASTNTSPPISLGAPVQLSPMTAGDDFDKELMAVDQSGGSNDGRIYIALSEGNFFIPPAVQVVVAHSTSTSPLTFSSWQSLSPADALNHGAMPAVGPDGEVYVVWGRFTYTGGSLTGETVRIVKSTDGGSVFKNPDSSDPAPSKTIATPSITPGTLGTGSNSVRTRGFPYIAVDPTPSGSPTRGLVYVVFQADPDGAGADKSDIFVTRSTDGGVHWSSPRSITSGMAATLNRDTTKNDNWQPSIAVSPVNGHIYVTFYDKRADPANTKARLYRALSTDGGLTWGNAPLASADFTPSTGYDALSGGYFGDYNWASADSAGIHHTWGDSRNLCSPPVAAPNPCSPSGRGDQDVYYSHAANLAGPDLFIQPWGAVTGIGPLWQTPDIFVVDASDNPINAVKGAVNHLRARVRNLGGAAAPGVTVRFKYAPWFAGITDALLKQIGTANVNFSPAGGGNDTKIVPIEWDLTDLTDTNGGLWPAPISSFVHFCVKVDVELASDVNLSNNSAQNNFVDVPTSSGSAPFRFLVGNPTEKTSRVRVRIGRLAPPFGASVKLEGGGGLEELRLKPREVRVATVRFAIPGRYDGREDVVANINLSIDGALTGGISARLYHAPGPKPDLSGLPPAKAPAASPKPQPTPQVSKEAPQPPKPEPTPPMRTIPLRVKYRRSYDAGFVRVFKALQASLKERREGVALADLERGLVNTKPVAVSHEQLIKLITPEDAKRIGKVQGRYFLSFWLQPAGEAKTQVGVDSMILAGDILDVPTGRRVHSNGTLEQGHLTGISRRLQ